MTKTLIEGAPAEGPPTRSRLDRALDRLLAAPPLAPAQRLGWLLGVAGYLGLAWGLVQVVLRDWRSDHAALDFYLLQPAVWLGLAALAYAGWRRLPERPPFSRVLTGIALLLGAFHVGLYVLGGVIVGFGESFVAGRLVNYPRNLWFLGTWLLGLEMARAFVFHAWRPSSERGAYLGTTLLLAVAMTPYGQLGALGSSDTLVSALGGFIIPTLVLSTVATWLVDHGGPGPSIAYRGVLLAFEWFSQVQPDLDWPLLFLIGTVGPILAARLIRTIYLSTSEGSARWEDHAEPETAGDDAGWYWTLVPMSLLIIGLGATALLGFRPAVVHGISMEPTLSRGDVVVVVRGIDPATLLVGDIVEYEDPTGHTIVHRITAIEQSPTGLVFTTQGNNNGGADPDVPAAEVTGKVLFAVPAVGWPAIWLRR